MEFHLVLTLRISSLLGKWAASRWRSNFFLFCGDEQILITSLRSYNNKYINIKITKPVQQAVLHIYDVFGRMLVNETLDFYGKEFLTVDLSSYPNGAYLIDLTTENKKFTKRIIKSD